MSTSEARALRCDDTAHLEFEESKGPMLRLKQVMEMERESPRVQYRRVFEVEDCLKLLPRFLPSHQLQGMPTGITPSSRYPCSKNEVGMKVWIALPPPVICGV
jgi:hypothetical protein